MKTPLTSEEENLIKDLLRHIGSDEDFNADMASAISMPVRKFDELSESIFQKLQNGRVRVIEN